ncbi:DUF6893 family small protein [Streptomyces sp. NPDC089424]
MNKRIISGAAAATAATAFAALVTHVMPDIKRYLRIRRM